MGGKKVECSKCDTHWVVVGEEEAKEIVDTHHLTNESHKVGVTPTDLAIGQDLRDLETARFMTIADLLYMLE